MAAAGAGIAAATGATGRVGADRAASAARVADFAVTLAGMRGCACSAAGGATTVGVDWITGFDCMVGSDTAGSTIAEADAGAASVGGN